MKYRYLAFSAVVALLMLSSNVVHAQKGGGGGGGRGGGAPGGARPAGAPAGARPAGAANMNNAHYHNGNNHNGQYHNGHYHYGPGFSVGFGFYPSLYGSSYLYPYGGYSYPYDYPYVEPRVAYYPRTIIVQGDSGPVSTSASVRVLVPSAQAKVFFDGSATKQEGTDRLFHTPSLTSSASYRVRAIWLENGKETVQEAVASVRPGEATTVDFTKATEELPIPK